MAAGLSSKQVSDRIRYRLQKIAAENGGEYVKASGSEPAQAKGVTEDGLQWSASFGVSRGSNGEVFGIPTYTVNDGKMEQSFSGLHGSLLSAIDSFRAEREGSLVYVVAYGGGSGDALTVTEDAVTRDLGRARWAQQQTGNVANLWEARQTADDTVHILREFPYTNKTGRQAMHAYMDANGLDIWKAQSTLETDPALAVVNTRALAPPDEDVDAPTPRI